MTPPLPSPPNFDPISFILFTTFISPTAVRSTEQLLASANLSKANDVDRLVTNVSSDLIDSI